MGQQIGSPTGLASCSKVAEKQHKKRSRSGHGRASAQNDYEIDRRSHQEPIPQKGERPQIGHLPLWSYQQTTELRAVTETTHRVCHHSRETQNPAQPPELSRTTTQRKKRVRRLISSLAIWICSEASELRRRAPGTSCVYPGSTDHIEKN